MSFTVLLKFCNNPGTNTSETFFLLNKFLKYKGRPLYIEEISDAGVIDSQQIVDIYGNFISYDETASAYDLIANSRSFFNMLSLYLWCFIKN